MRRGFKAWCEDVATEYRSVLGLKAEDPLNPQDLATHLGVTVWRPEDVPELSEKSLRQLILNGRDSWSAVTIRLSGVTVTILNSAHAVTRQRSSLSHELSHLILDHGPGRIDLSPEGHLLLSSFEPEQEEEADWLSATLLVPRSGLQTAFRLTQDSKALADRFGVSPDLLNWRLRLTGVAIQARRALNRPTR